MENFRKEKKKKDIILSDTKKFAKWKPCNIFIYNFFLCEIVTESILSNNATLGCYKYGTEFVGFKDKCPNQIVQIFDSIIPQKIK